jgi:hypothetical protein
MLKAYIEFAAISAGQYDKNGQIIGEVRRSTWPDLVTECQKKHQMYIKQIYEGNYYQNIEKDPRKNPGPDEKVDIGAALDNSVNAGSDQPAYNRNKSVILNDTVQQTKITPAAKKFVNKFLDRAREKKEAAEKEAAVADKEEPKTEELTSNLPKVSPAAKQFVKEWLERQQKNIAAPEIDVKLGESLPAPKN